MGSLSEALSRDSGSFKYSLSPALRERTFVSFCWVNSRAHSSAHTARSCRLDFLPNSHPNLWDPQLLFPSRSLAKAASGVSRPRRGSLDDSAPDGRGAPLRASALVGKLPHTLTPRAFLRSPCSWAPQVTRRVRCPGLFKRLLPPSLFPEASGSSG